MMMTDPDYMWHESGELAMNYVDEHPGYVAVEFHEPEAPIAWASVRSAAWLAAWLENPANRIFYAPKPWSGRGAVYDEFDEHEMGDHYAYRHEY